MAIQLKRGTAARWAELDPVLFIGEPGLDTTNFVFKLGDGVRRWSELPYINVNPEYLNSLVDAIEGDADSASLSATTATTKASEAQSSSSSAASSAASALASKNAAETAKTQAEAALAVIPTQVDTQVTAKVADLDLVERFDADPYTPWRWFLAYATGEVGIGERTDGTLYPNFLNPSYADTTVKSLDPTRGWRFAVYYSSGEVVFGVRSDGTLYPAVATPTSSTVTIRVSGDSLTANWSPYISGLKTLLGTNYTVIAEGDGGRRSEWIAAKQGGQPLRVTASGNLIPASGSVNVTVAAWNHIGASPPYYVATTLTVTLNNVKGTLTIVDDTTGAGTFTRAQAGREVPIAPGTPAFRDFNRDAWPILWAGRNNFKLSNDGAQILRDTTDMFNFADPTARKKALVLSILPWVGEENGTGVRATLDSVNASLRDAFPTQYLDVGALLRSQATLLAVGITPTATDIENIGNGLTPESFRLPSDAGHLNAKGYEALNMIINETYRARGFVV